ncbi:MAG: GNAT family N-acetyltransferase [Patescibacteria group bacterium]
MKHEIEMGIPFADLSVKQKKGIIDQTNDILSRLLKREEVDVEAVLASALSSSASRRPLRRMRQAIMFFFETASRNLASDTYNETERTAMAHHFSDMGSALIRHLTPAQALVASSQILRIKEFQRVVGNAMTDQIAKRIAAAPETIGNSIVDVIEQLSASEQLDAIHQLTTVSSRILISKIAAALNSRSVDEIIESARQRSAVGDCTTAYNTLVDAEKSIKGIINSIRNRLPQQLVQYACNEAAGAIDERHNFFVSSKTSDEIYNEAVSYGDPTYGRQVERAEESWFFDDIHLREQIAVPRQPLRLPSENRQLLHRIASDAVALYDHAMIPEDIGRVDFSQMPTPHGPSVAFAEALLQNREVLEMALPHSLSQTILRFFPLFIIDQSPEQLAHVFGSVSTAMKREEWTHYFSLWKDLLDEKGERGGNKEHATLGIILIEKRLKPIMDTVVKDLFRSAEKTLQESAYSPMQANFKQFHTIQSDPELNPYIGSKDENIPLLLQHLHRPNLRSVIEADLGISFAEVPITSQIHLLRFLATADTAMFKRLSRCLKSSGELRTDVLRSFMTAAESPATAQTILDVFEKYHNNPEQLTKIFKLLRTITDAASFASNYLRSQYKERDDQEIVRKTIQRLLQKTKNVLESSLEGRDVENSESLNNTSTEILLLTLTFRTLRESGLKVPLSEIEGIDMTILRGEELKRFAAADDNWKRMEEIYRSRYANTKYPEEFKTALVEGLRLATEKGETALYVVKHEGEIIAYCRFDTRDDGSLYFGSFVIDERYDNHKLGIALLEESLLKLGVTHRIEADCDPDSPAAKIYEKLGFVVTEHYDYKGVPSTHIIRVADSMRHQTQSAA